MSETSKVQQESKSWADIVEEEEEYNKLHPEDDVQENTDSDQITTTTTAEKEEAQQTKEADKGELVQQTIEREAAVEQPDTVKEEIIYEDSVKEETANVDTVNEEPVHEESAKEINEEPVKEDKPALTGAKASRWANAPSEPPKTSKWASSSTNNENSSSSGAMASKWANSSSSYGNRSRYDNNNDRYNNNYRYNNNRYNNDRYNIDRPTGGRLNRSTFEDDVNKNNNSSRNHYDRDFDRDDRNGGFDNKDNFINRKQLPQEDDEATAKAIKGWNSYKPPADENDVVEEKPKAEEKAEEKPKVVEKKEERLPLDDIANFKPASFSWADDMDNSDDDYEDELFADQVTPAPKEDNLSNATKEDDLSNTDAPEPVPKDDGEPPAPIEKDECFKVDEPAEEKPLPPVYNWGSIEESKDVKDVEEQPAEQENVIKSDPETKPLPSYAWGALEDYKPEPVQEPTVAVDEESALRAWNSLGESANIEEKPLPKTPPTEVEVVAVESESDWNKNVSWNNATTIEQPVEQQNESWNNNVSWDNNTTDQPQETWTSFDNVATPPVAEAKPVIKDSWKNKLAVTEEDNASAWKSFADTIAVPPPAPVVKEEKKKEIIDVSAPQSWNSVQQEEKKKEDISAPQSWDTVQQSASWNTTQPQASWNTVQQEEPKSAVQPPVQPAEAPKASWGSFVEAETKPKEISMKLSDITSTKPAEPVTASFKLSDFTTSSAPTPSAAKSPSMVSLKLSDFTGPSTPTASFKLSDFETKNVSLRLGDITSSEKTKQPHTVSLKFSDLGITSSATPPPPPTTDTSNMPSLRLSDFNTPTHSFKLSDFNEPPPVAPVAPVAQVEDDWKASASWDTPATHTTTTPHHPHRDPHHNPPTPTITERHPEQWGQGHRPITFVDSSIVETTERPRRKLQKAGGQWNALQKNLMGSK